jgi:diacylglycerol kinase (ATP)
MQSIDHPTTRAKISMRLSGISSRLKSFKYALQGIGCLFRTQTNAQIHLMMTILVIVMAFFFKVTLVEWSLLILCIMAVLAAEAFNSALEFLADAVTQSPHPLIGKAKDLAAGGVLIAAIGAASVGTLIFAKRVIHYALQLTD